jgi:hypothetical protein
LHFPRCRSPDQHLLDLLTLAGAPLEVFGVVVVTSEAVENLCDARLSFFSLRGCVVSSLQ